jgi:hypothetical protein
MRREMSKQYAAIAWPPFPELAVARRLKKPTVITQMSGNLADNENNGAAGSVNSSVIPIFEQRPNDACVGVFRWRIADQVVCLSHTEKPSSRNFKQFCLVHTLQTILFIGGFSTAVFTRKYCDSDSSQA